MVTIVGKVNDHRCEGELTSWGRFVIIMGKMVTILGKAVDRPGEPGQPF